MKLRIERIVPFPRDSVYAWWTGFRGDDHHGPGSVARSEQTILRREGNEVRLRDRATRPARATIEEHVTLDPPTGYAVEARYPGAEVRYEYRFKPLDGGTRIVLEAYVRPRHVGWIVVPLTQPWWRRYAERDTDAHLREMNRDLGGPS
jgi:hypothetical protein